MTDLARIKRNVARMVSLGAPEADIDGYIASEGVTVEDVRNFKGVTRLTGGVPDRGGFAERWGKNPDPTIGDQAMSFARGVIEGIPVVGGPLADARRALDANITAFFRGGDAQTYQDQYKAADEQLAAQTPWARAGGQIAGAVGSLAPLGATALGGRLLGMAGSIPTRIGMGAVSGAALSAADTAVDGGDFGQIATNGAIGGILGGAFPAAGALVGKIGQGMAQRAATNAAIKGAPAAADLKSVASSMFQQLDQSGVQVSGQRFGQMAMGLIQKFTKMRANPKLDPKAVAALEDLVNAANDVVNSGGGIALSDLHTLRQIAQKAALSAEGRDAMFSQQIIGAIDDMVNGLKPSDIIGGADPAQASNLMLDAISTWGRSKRVGLIEEAIYQAQNAASGFENGLRIQFRRLLKPDVRKSFTAAEIQAIEEVANGTAVSNLTKLLGKFGFAPNNMLGGTIGALGGSAVGGPLAGIALSALGTGARKVSEKMTSRAAQRAAQVVATPGVPVLPSPAMRNVLVAPAVLPLQVTQRREPVDITVRGGR